MDLISMNSKGLRGSIRLKGDKSISHRTAILLPLCHGDAVVNNFLFAEDTLHTLKAMRMIGANIEIRDDNVIIKSKGNNNFKVSPKSIYLGNSGTSIRLLSGLFSSIEGYSVLYGDDSLLKRPMGRVIKPLRMMGADIKSLYDNDKAPLIIKGNELHGIEFEMDVPSAQVKSAILIAGLFAKGKTKIVERQKTRDHTERMLKYLGAEIKYDDNVIELSCNQELIAKDLFIPGDISSAAFLIAAATLVKNSEVVIHDVLLNPTRTGFLDALKLMGGEFEIFNFREINNEPIGSIRVVSSKLKGIKIEGEIIPRIIDEIPLIAVLAAFAEGETVIRDAQELKYKESDRIQTIVYNLKEMGVKVETTDDGMIIQGQCYLKKDKYIFNSFNDHRIAMAFSLVGLVLDNARVLNCYNIRTSFPEFVDIMREIGANIYIC